jgi:hypothetical protein
VLWEPVFTAFAGEGCNNEIIGVLMCVTNRVLLARKWKHFQGLADDFKLTPRIHRLEARTIILWLAAFRYGVTAAFISFGLQENLL